MTVKDATQSYPQVDQESAPPTVGVLTTWLHAEYESDLVRGVIDAVQAAGANAVCVVGGELSRPSPANVGFELVAPERFDGLVITPSLGHEMSDEAIRAFCERFASLPMVSGALPVSGITKVVPDSSSGMRQAVEHMLDVHNYQRIAFLCGPAGQIEAEARYQAYVDVLSEHNIPVDPELVLQGDYRRVSGRAAMETLLARNVPFDALVSANDDMAIGALEVLSAHGLHVPEDVALLGFDDAEEAQYLNVPLTTVRQSVYKLAQQMGDLLLQKIRGEEVPELVTVPAELVVRRSCGCLSHAIQQLANDSPLARGKTKFERNSSPPGVPLETWQAFFDDFQGTLPGGFLLHLDQRINHMYANMLDDLTAPVDLDFWQTVFSGLHYHAQSHVTQREKLLRAQQLLQQARVLLGEFSSRVEGQQRLALLQRESLLQRFNTLLTSALDLDELAAAIERYFADFGIHYGYVLLYEGAAAPAEDSRLLLAYEAQKASAYVEGPLFDTFDLLPARAVLDKPYAFVLQPLFLREWQLGYLILDAGFFDGGLYDQIREQISGAIFRSLLIQQQEKARLESDLAHQKSEDTLRDLMVLQKQLVRDSWENYAMTVPGYIHSSRITGVTEDAWLPIMTSAVEGVEFVSATESESLHSLALPITLFDEVIGVLGFRGEMRAEWSEEDIAFAEEIGEQVALALENRRLLIEVQQRASRLTAAAEIARAATSITTLDDLLPQAVALISDRFDLYYAGIFLVDDNRQWAVLKAGSGDAGRVMVADGYKLELAASSMISSCVASGQARITFDVATESMHQPNPHLPKTRSELALPLMSRGVVIGAMTIQSQFPGAFTEEDITTFQTMADQLGNAIENARLILQMQENVKALEAARGEYTLESWQKLAQRIGRPLSYRYRLGLEAAPPYSEEAKMALQQQRVVNTKLVHSEVAPEASQAKSALAVPIRLWGRVIGVVNLRFEEENIPENAVDLVEKITDQLALSLENARLIEKTQARAAREQLTGTISARMRESLDMDIIMETAVRELREALGIDKVDLRLNTKQLSVEK